MILEVLSKLDNSMFLSTFLRVLSTIISTSELSPWLKKIKWKAIDNSWHKLNAYFLLLTSHDQLLCSKLTNSSGWVLSLRGSLWAFPLSETPNEIRNTQHFNCLAVWKSVSQRPASHRPSCMNRPEKLPVFLNALGLIACCLLCCLSRFNVPGHFMAPCNFILKGDLQNFVILINWKFFIPD